MIDRIRRARKAPNREPTEFVEEMHDVRAQAVHESRAVIHRINKLGNVLNDGEVDYDELNRVLFGRTGWPREGSSS